MQLTFGYNLLVTSYHGDVADHEASLWEQYYLPADPKGKTVLSLGAGCGEDAAFYLSKGASKVVCVESDPFAFFLLDSNVKRLKLPVEPISSLFKLEHMEITHDILKSDCEEGEKLPVRLARGAEALHHRGAHARDRGDARQEVPSQGGASAWRRRPHLPASAAVQPAS